VKLRLFVGYRSPSSNSDPTALQYVKDLCDCIDSLFPVHSPALICGDLNFPNIDWTIDNCAVCSETTCTGVFLELYYTHGLRQCVTTPTRFDNVLDLILTNDDNCIYNIRPIEPFSTSDHNQILFMYYMVLLSELIRMLLETLSMLIGMKLSLFSKMLTFTVSSTAIYLPS
jgi:hypothetical protein